ncbi:S8 family peptidase [Halalkalibacterium ligniniphilum]|uniref:S8 family peptidase n=1 Tax=Halalkalibacterium ligniniphilum TaxID=1134413 RepID=UPI0003495EF8|nr:S8 family peptidase [Halalkalibacterium ligniniphilum]
MRAWRIIGILTAFLLVIIFIGRGVIEDNRDHRVNIQQKEIPEALEANAMDKLLAEDLSLTTSMFINQLSEQLQRWKDADLSDQSIRGRFEQELQDHRHFQGFAIAHENGKIEKVGSIHQPKPSLLTHTHHQQQFSDPYQVGDKQYMLIGEKIDNKKTLIGEIDLSFVKRFINNTASVADANGNFFISSDNPKVQWKSVSDAPDNLMTETVPEVGWEIHVHSEEQNTKEKPRPFHERQAVIKFKQDSFAEPWLASHPEYTVIETAPPFYILTSKTKTTEELLQELSHDLDLSFAEPNYRYSKQVPTFKTTPNDEFFKPYQWNLEQINIQGGWNFSEGEDVTIAVLDTGVDMNHQDLQIKIKKGYNTVDGNTNFQDEHGHGTHVAGIAAALTNNIKGIAGISWDSAILPVKVLNKEGEGTSFEVAKGIYWATDNGADVINMSLGDYNHSDALYDAIRYAYQKDVVLIAASGNDNAEDPMYPALYDEVLTVAAVDDTKNRAFFSNYGKHIDVAAPGEHIPSLFPDNQYVVMSGTSMAAPHVAGFAALIRAMRPDLSNNQVVDVIKKTAKDLGPKGHDPYYGYGEIDIEKALSSLAK